MFDLTIKIDDPLQLNSNDDWFKTRYHSYSYGFAKHV